MIYKNIQVPEVLHRHIKQIAAAEGKSMIALIAEATGFLEVKK